MQFFFCVYTDNLKRIHVINIGRANFSSNLFDNILSLNLKKKKKKKIFWLCINFTGIAIIYICKLYHVYLRDVYKTGGDG